MSSIFRPLNPSPEFNTAQGGWLSRLQTAIRTAWESPKEYETYQIHYAAPAKVEAGRVYYADGTTWNPGSGEGLYRYSLAGAWVHLG